MTPSEIENFKAMFPEFGDLDADEVLLQQASALSYIQSNQIYSGSGESEISNQIYSASGESEIAHGTSSEQLALDEAIAKSLEFADFDGLYISEPAGNAHSLGNVGSSSYSRDAHTSAQNEDERPMQNHINPDTMTYEELTSLGESVGTESKGLPLHLISLLPTFKHKIGFFDIMKRKEKQECVICYSEFKNGNKLSSLPCAHTYHSDCIARWLQDSKTCPVCKKEVQADSFSS